MDFRNMDGLWWSSTGRLLLVFAVAILLIVFRLIYNLFLHPLRSFPGPWYATSSIAWHAYHAWAGTQHEAIHALHLKYGAVVRIAPDELSFVEAEAWKDIYGRRPEFPKDVSQTHADDPEHAHLVVLVDPEKHRTLRKILSPAFSDRALHSQEALIDNYAMELIKALGKRGGEPVDMARWYNYTTFDIIGHLAFAESFDCLSGSAYHPWVETIYSSVRLVAWKRMLGRVVPGLVSILQRIVIPSRLRRESKSHWQMVAAKLARRREKKLDYTDFAEHLLQAEQDGVLHPKDLLNNLPMLVVAGSETTASALSGTTYYMLTNPPVYTRLASEIRSQFKDHASVTLPRLSALKYLPAVIEESLRMYPPAPSNHPRVVSPDGGTVCGRFIPGGTLVGVPHWACFRSPHNFARPEEFVPERFLGDDEQFANDKRDALQPFHVGARNCIGRNLAYIEMRLILTRLLLEFDLELLPESRGWENQLVFAIGVKPPLMVKLHPVRKS
ncbi:putative cytochrome P450 monooxygenase [Xylaria telfairii]|nr:putative cytochrome P450 monooxygenase [Xylaria telfairii]